MLNIPLFWEDFRENKKIWLIFFGGMLFAALLTLGLYGWASGRLGANVFLDVPEPLARILGLDMTDKSLTGFICSALYECWFLLILIAYTLLLSKRLVTDQMERRTMIYYVGSPLGRGTVIFTQGYFLVFSLFALLFGGALGTALLSEWIFPGQVEIPQFLLLNIGCFCLHAALGGIGFFFACAADSEKQAMAGKAVVVLFLLLYLAGNAWERLGVLRFLTPLSLFDGAQVLEGARILFLKLPLLAVLGGVFYWLGMWVFRKKDFFLAGKHQNSKGL